MKSTPMALFAPALYLTVCAVAAGLLAYPLHFLLPAADFHGLATRAGQALLLLGLIPLGRTLGMGWKDLGIQGTAVRFARQLALGFVLGVIMLGLHIFILVLFGARVALQEKLNAGFILDQCLKGFLVGIGIGLLEEPMFRGFLLGSLARKLHPLIALLVSSAYFAALHSFRTDLRPGFDEVRWHTGLELVLDSFRHLPQMHLDMFVPLLAAGFFLGCARLAAPIAGLSYSIGIHAGWVFVLKISNPLTRINWYSPWRGLVSPYDGNIGYFSAAWTALLILPLALKIVKMRRQSRDA